MRAPVGAAYFSPLSTYRFPSRSISASSPPTRDATLRGSPADRPLCARSMDVHACSPHYARFVPVFTGTPDAR